MADFRAQDGTEFHYEDIGSGHPVILIHGWPLSSAMWEAQFRALADNGFRCIAYDRRGFGWSQRPWNTYTYDTLADDLRSLIQHLKLSSFSLVGFSMGGGEIARYFSRHGGQGVTKSVLISSVVPFMLKTADNPDGVPASVFDDMILQIQKDRPAFLASFLKTFMGVGAITSPVSTETLQWNHALAMQAAPWATVDCVRAFAQTDFRPDLPSFNKPTLVIHGDADKIVPIDATGRATAKALGSRLQVIKGGPHAVCTTHAGEINELLLGFLR